MPGRPINPIVLDETSITENVDLEINVDDIQNLPATVKELRRYGLDLIPVERELDMFVIKQNDMAK